MTTAPLREIRPLPVPMQLLIQGPLVCGFGACFIGFGAFVISNMVSHSFQPQFWFGIAAFVIAFVGFLSLAWMKTFVEPGKTMYAIYADRIETSEGLWNRHSRTVVFDQVVDVELTEGVLQQTLGVGTVTVVTQQLVSSGEGNLSNRRVALQNVPQPREVYDLIRALALRIEQKK